MKKILFGFLTLVMPLFSENLPSENAPKIEEFWNWNESYLFLNIDLDAGLKFGDIYHTFELQDGNPGAEIHFLPWENSSFVKNDCPLEDVTFTLYLSYDQNKHLLNYEILEKFVYENSGWISSSTVTTATTIKGKISNMDIDTSEKPQFFVDERSPHKGYFVFKKMQ